MDTINLMPTWEQLWQICKDGEFPKVYEELLKPCQLADKINKSLEDGATVVKIYKGGHGSLMYEDGLEE